MTREDDGPQVDNRLGDGPIDPRHDQMNDLAVKIDQSLNPGLKPGEQTVGFILMVFPFGDSAGRCSCSSNSCREDVINVLTEQLTHFLNDAFDQPERKGDS